MAVESRASRDVLIGEMALRRGFPLGLGISTDGGSHWQRLQTETLTEPLYRDERASSEPNIRTWSEHDWDTPIPNDFSIVQIETDPRDERTFYVVTWKGVYATRDQARRSGFCPCPQSTSEV